MRLGFWPVLASICVVLLQTPGAQAQSAALTGQVSSAGEPKMEGVLVSARKAGSSVTVTVVTNDQGRYAFPADRLEPGSYAISIRAIGYKLDGPKTAEVSAGAAATADVIAPEPPWATGHPKRWPLAAIIRPSDAVSGRSRRV